ncbi:MAG TPA: sulfite exporter TauE/SafE family protein, partial [Chitinivibrionales bacterium]
RSGVIIISILSFSAIIFLASVGAGLLGSLTGLGGGIIIVPLLTIPLGVDIHYAMGASLASVLATSSGAAAANAHEGFANFKIGMFLEIAATLGALAGTIITAMIAGSWVATVFGLVLLYSAYIAMVGHSEQNIATGKDLFANRLRLHGEFPGPHGPKHYYVGSVPAGFTVMAGAGLLSGLLGIGSGALKVVAMDRIMKIPFKVSTATSNFMIGITAAACAGVYLHRGYMNPGLVMPVILGVLTGSITGARLLPLVKTEKLRMVFAVTIALLGMEMLYKGISGNR